MTHVLTQLPGFKINQLFHGFSNFKSARRQAQFNQAFENICDLLEETYPQWTACLFDRSFLTTEAAPLFKNGNMPTPMQLAHAWHCQFGLTKNREANIEIILPVVADFLDLLYLEINFG